MVVLCGFIYFFINKMLWGFCLNGSDGITQKKAKRNHHCMLLRGNARRCLGKADSEPQETENSTRQLKYRAILITIAILYYSILYIKINI